MPQEAKAMRGFTLVELMMALAIVAVLATVAIPAFGNLLGRTRQQVVMADLQASLNQARSAAVSRGMHVIACPSVDQSTCLHTTQWHLGWLLFADRDHDGQRSDEEPVIGGGQAQPEGIGILATVGRPRIDYQSDGSASGTNITLTVCDRAAGPTRARTLVVSQSGRIRLGQATAGAASDCIAGAG
ncbi:GspH/FimT family pseudopilin [Dokdonella sp.]|uniref:GspH/FimT family pseudopilin n=1 Tax=Dokdonella sp. TaxID=2291710 RepID=UPI0037842DC0